MMIQDFIDKIGAIFVIIGTVLGTVLLICSIAAFPFAVIALLVELLFHWNFFIVFLALLATFFVVSFIAHTIIAIKNS